MEHCTLCGNGYAVEDSTAHKWSRYCSTECECADLEDDSSDADEADEWPELTGEVL